MTIQQFVTSGLTSVSPIFPRVTVVFSPSLSALGISNGSDHYDSKETGGYEPADSYTLTFQREVFTDNPKTLIGKIVTINDEKWRINRVKVGSVAVHMDFVSPNHI